MNAKQPLPDETTLWRAVQERDPRYDGLLYYAVRSTGVYCRPTCPSRRPRRAQVLFFASCDSAEEAGFRPCLRCRPRDPENPAAALVRRAQEVIEQAGEPLSLSELGRKVGASPYHLQRVFKAATGLSPRQYAAVQRASRFKTGVRAARTITSALYEAGYGSSSRLYESAPGFLGMPPAAYRTGGAGMRLTYTITGSPLGRLLLAASPQGVCAVRFGEDDERLLAELAAEFPNAELARDDAQLAEWASAARACTEGFQPAVTLPLDVQGTAFQQRVWAELRQIPRGQTRTYTQVAEAIGQPRAVRAVARACATNPAALLIPCHRVVRSDGSLAGYRWGVARKQALLEAERQPEGAPTTTRG